MRIFQVITASEYGGAQTLVADLIKSFSPDNEVFVLYGGEGEAWSRLGNRFTRIRLCPHRKGTSWKDILLLLKLFYYRFKYRPDIVHLHSSKMAALGRIAFNPKTIVYTLHGFDSVRKAYPKFLVIEKKLQKRSAIVLGVSKYDVGNMQKEDINHKLTYVYNGVADNYGKGLDRVDAISEKLKQLKRDYPKVVMCISRISQQKNFPLFLEIAEAMPEYAFTWIGNKDPMDNLPSNMCCLGSAYAASEYLNYADIFILPTHYEGLPMCILEALSFAVPVVASNVGGIPEVLNGENGFAVANKVDVFKEKIKLILSNEETQKKFSEEARKSYLDKFTVEQMVGNYRDIYEKVVAIKI